MKYWNTPALALTFVVAVALATGCKDDHPTPAAAPDPAKPGATALPPTLRLAAAPAGAKDVAAVRAAAPRDGDRVIVRGVIAGRADPIAPTRAILTLLDPAIKTCDKEADDTCKTPWDACCVPADERTRNSVTVQVVDPQGHPLKTSLASVDGVKPLARLVVAGTAKVTPDGTLLINADGVFVER